MCLGDLSRYREMYSLDFNSSTSDYDFRPAINYYTIAKKFIPENGFPHNQLAVISSLEGSVLGSTYHFYRSMCVDEPFPTAESNLLLSLKKTLKSSQNIVAREDKGGDSRRRDEILVAPLIEKFLLWHAQVTLQSAPKYKNNEISSVNNLDVLASEIMQQLESDIREREVTTDILNRMVLINISAYYISTVQGSMNCRPVTSHQLLWFNIMCITSLLKVLLVEMDNLHILDTTDQMRTKGLTVVNRRILPAVRIYSSWLKCHIGDILHASQSAKTPSISDGAFGDLKEFWSDYCDAMSMISVAFGDQTFEKVDVLLNEDVDLIGFIPLRAGLTGIRAEAQHMTISEMEDRTSRVHPTSEAFWRISDILADANALANKGEVPLVYEDERYIYYPPPISSAAGSVSMSTPVPDFDSQSFVSTSAAKDHSSIAFVDPAIASISSTPRMARVGDASVSRMVNDMVDSLLDDDTRQETVQSGRERQQSNDVNDVDMAVPVLPHGELQFSSSPWGSVAVATSAASREGAGYYSRLTSAGAFGSVMGTADFMSQQEQQERQASFASFGVSQSGQPFYGSQVPALDPSVSDRNEFLGSSINGQNFSEFNRQPQDSTWHATIPAATAQESEKPVTSSSSSFKPAIQFYPLQVRRQMFNKSSAAAQTKTSSAINRPLVDGAIGPIGRSSPSKLDDAPSTPKPSGGVGQLF